MRMTGPFNRKKARQRFGEIKRYSMEYGEDATPLSHRFSASNPKRNKTMKMKKEGQNSYASPFMGQEKNISSVSMVVGLNNDDTLFQTASCEAESPGSRN